MHQKLHRLQIWIFVSKRHKTLIQFKTLSSSFNSRHTIKTEHKIAIMMCKTPSKGALYQPKLNS